MSAVDEARQLSLDPVEIAVTVYLEVAGWRVSYAVRPPSSEGAGAVLAPSARSVDRPPGTSLATCLAEALRLLRADLLAGAVAVS